VVRSHGVLDPAIRVVDILHGDVPVSITAVGRGIVVHAAHALVLIVCDPRLLLCPSLASDIVITLPLIHDRVCTV
jgi:hypothetical protein